MADQEPIASGPEAQKKPISSKKWGAGIIIGVVILFVFLDLITNIHLTAPASGHNSKQAVAPITAASVKSFDDEAKQMAQDLTHRREALQAAIDKAKDVDLSRLIAPLPECNQAMRDKLNGHYYSSATTDGTPVHLSCEANDQWAVIPEAALSIQPMTAQQEQTEHRIGGGGSTTASAADRKKQERERRRAEALNSSSIALDFEHPVKVSATERPATADIPPSDEEAKQEGAAEKPAKYDWDTYTGQLYRIFEGTVIETVLTNRLNGEFTGPVNVMVTTNVYSHDHQHILMPQGTRVLGEAVRVSVAQQRRLGVVFHRVIMPDGYSVDLDKFAGLDQQGASGLTGRVDTHWKKLIGTAVLVGAIGGLAQIGGYGTGYSSIGAIRSGVGEQSGQEATQILNRALNVLPTVTVYEGTRVRIWTMQDTNLPAYENHTVSPTL